MVSGEPALESPTIDVSSKEFHGTCTNIKKKELEFNILLFDANKAEMSTMHTLESYSHLLVSIPFVIGIGDMMLQHIEFLKSTLMDWNLQWLCYLSSTNVYGVCRGVYVVNGYPTSTTNEMVLRLAVEQEWLNLVLDIGLKTHVFRLGDCQALKASTCIQLSQRIYNIIDDDPTSQGKGMNGGYGSMGVAARDQRWLWQCELMVTGLSKVGLKVAMKVVNLLGR
ncbi:hypothetical protein V6N13_106902 [Hibiscus sabdariffa]